ncbi:MAG: hypothetical protein AABZ44_10595 [Elusimicrobiota bacterium]
MQLDWADWLVDIFLLIFAVALVLFGYYLISLLRAWPRLFENSDSKKISRLIGFHEGYKKGRDVSKRLDE